ncbi:MAG: sulfotransferase family protein [Anaerolineales bacterium]
MRRPDFFISGAPRCGTTALYTYLCEHPHIFMPKVKELDYFATDFPDLQKVHFSSIEDYLSVFAGARDHHLALGDASPLYLYSSYAFGNIRAFNPNAKIILTLRSPIRFVQSIHQLNLSLLREDEEDLEKAWRLQDERKQGRHIPAGSRSPVLLMYGELGQFGKYLQRLYEVFPREQVLVLIFEDFVCNPADVYETILAFIEVPSDHRSEFLPVNANFKNRSSLLARLFHPPQFIYKTFMKSISLLGPGFMNSVSVVYNKLEKMNTTPTGKVPLEPEFKALLQDHFRDDVATLSELINRDLSFWLD